MPVRALGVHPGKKYESEGGPGARAIVELVREHSGAPLEDVDTFVASLVLHWLIGGTDAHAKNYSLLIGAGGRARLAPLYDVASALPYAGSQVRKLKLAMKIGGKYRMHEIGLYQWRKLARDLRLDEDHVVGLLRGLAAAAADASMDVLRRARRDELAEALLLRLAKAVSERAKRVAAL